MPMQFVSHRDPVDVGGWSTALGATGDAIGNILNIYGGYQKQKRMDAQQALENKWREDEVRMRDEERKRSQEMNDLNIELKRYDLERQVLKEGLPGARPTVKTGEETVDAALDFQVQNKPKGVETDFSADFKLPALTTAFGQAATPQAPVTGDFGQGQPAATLAGVLSNSMQPQQPFALDLKQPTVTRDVMGAAPVEQRNVRGIQFRGQEFAPALTGSVKYEDEIRKEKEAAELEKQINDGSMTRLAEEEKALLIATGNPQDRAVAARGVLPTTTYNALITSKKKPGIDPSIKIFDKQSGKHYAWNDETQKYDIVVGQVTPERDKTAVAAADQYGGIAGQDRLDEIRKKDPRRAQLIEGMVKGTVDPYKTSSLRGTDRANIIADAQLVDPTYNPADAGLRVKTRQDFATGAAATNIRSINTAIKHISTLDDAVQELGSTRFPWVNKGINWFRTKTGDPKVARLQTAAMAVATEMAAALKGGRAAPTTQEINEHLAIIGDAASPEQWRSVMETRGDLLAGRLTSLEEQYAQVFGGKKPDEPLIFASTAKVLKGLGLDKFFSEDVSTEEEWVKDASGKAVRRLAK